MNPDLKKIKKLYGEKMMHLCRTLFPTILEEPGRLVELLTDTFEPGHYICDDIVKNNRQESFQAYIIKLNEKDDEKEEVVEKSVRELLSEAGYDFFECNTEEEIQSFRKYYQPKEELCTFWTNRLNNCHVFWAIKKNVDEIKRENFKNPNRQDEYGTSVISIQFTKNNNNTLSIKNRYNHTVSNPDATFSNNLDNIIPGLSNAFEREYGFKVSSSSNTFEIPGYVKTSNNKYYKYNYEIDNIYYCVNNVIIENFEPKQYEKEKYIVMDYFTLDLVNKKMTINENSPIAKEDSFIDEFNDIEKINVINVEGGKKEVRITTKTNHEIIIGLDDRNRIISYHNPRITEVKDNLLHHSKFLERLSLPNVVKVGNNCIARSTCLNDINMPNVREIGDGFLKHSCIRSLSFENLEKIGNDFLSVNGGLEKINIPKVKEIGNNFMGFNLKLSEIDLPSVEKIGDCFLNDMTNLKRISAPKLRSVGNYFLTDNKDITEISFPCLEQVGEEFISRNRIINNIYLPKLKKAGSSFLSGNDSLTSISLPNLEEAGDMFLLINKDIESIDLPKLRKVGQSFLHNNTALKRAFLPSLEQTNNSFLVRNECLEEIVLPKLKSVGTSFLASNNALLTLDLPNLEMIGGAFLSSNEVLERLSVPKLRVIKEEFLMENKNLTYLDISSVETMYLSYVPGYVKNSQKIVNNFLPYNSTLKEIKASKLNRSSRDSLSTRFKIISEEEKKEEKVAEQKIEEVIPLKEEISDAPIIQIEKSPKTLSSKINSIIRKGINFFSRSSNDKEIGGIKK